MKATGIVRKLDQLGRIVLPKELRSTFDIQPGDPVEIFTNGFAIIVKKYNPACIICGEEGEITSFEGKNICKRCLKQIKKL